MKDFWNKSVKIAAITGACIAAIVALSVLTMLAYIGGNAFLTGAAIQKETPMVIIAGNVLENTFCSLGYSFLVLLLNLSMLILFAFIIGVWILTTIWILREDIENLWGKAKSMFKNIIRLSCMDGCEK